MELNASYSMLTTFIFWGNVHDPVVQYNISLACRHGRRHPSINPFRPSALNSRFWILRPSRPAKLSQHHSIPFLSPPPPKPETRTTQGKTNSPRLRLRPLLRLPLQLLKIPIIRIIPIRMHVLLARAGQFGVPLVLAILLGAKLLLLGALVDFALVGVV